ncbi:MAG: pyrroline-5-carboxylate reductase [Anaeromicrobium sp.]|jgi:pyrroline-5-carboxylate reductase|uniref:pyrroline-5-carboxylate reductase n=1 Tax=Anaeromicrobium sp. TaxID=1929132 RepID=UPI0025D9620E|nr:pyrroline-5-carboxylate reductase [Anaeromicrobium sp.]MCT4595353.1 pyrroline-5-carboxylate reductase [Anaeromicrobium sp.]
MNKRIGFIGCGNMGGAMIGGIIKSGLVQPKNITVSDLDEKKLDHIKDSLGINTTTDSVELVNKSDIIILSVKPNIYDMVINSIKDNLTKDKLIVTIAAGVSLNHMENLLGPNYKIVRTMPNTPALVSEGMSALCPNKNISKEELHMIRAIFESFGKAELVKESLMDSVIGVSGSSPAYVFMFIEAMADAAVLGGMSRDNAYKFAAQSVLGSAKMVLQTGMHPGKLKDMVCSPGGTTIEAVSVLEKEGFRSSVIQGILACIDKSKKMSGN